MLEDKDGKSPIADKFHYDSLSYDIIKAHGGEIKVETKEDESAKFIIMLPSKENL